MSKVPLLNQQDAKEVVRTVISQRRAYDHLPSSGPLREEYVAFFCKSTQSGEIQSVCLLNYKTPPARPCVTYDMRNMM